MAIVINPRCTANCTDPCCVVRRTDYYDTSYSGSACARTGGTDVPTPNVCSCPWDMSESGGPGPDTPYFIMFRYYDFAPLTVAKNLTAVWDAFGGNGNGFVVRCWDGVTLPCSILVNTGCTTGSGSTTVSVPVGTYRILVEVSGGCNAPSGFGDLWSITLSCP
jgi:hypothetical protein